MRKQPLVQIRSESDIRFLESFRPKNVNLEHWHKKTRIFPRFLSSGACAAEGAGGIEPPFAKANMNPAVLWI